MRSYLIYIFICLCGTHLSVVGQNNAIRNTSEFLIKNKGIPFIKNFTPKDYKASNQNWAITQDNRGVMYFGNNNGILEFDGSNWRLIELPNKSVVRALTKDDQGRIYVGALSEIGYLAPDSLGKMEYKSLLPLLPKNERNFNDMWNIYLGSDAIYMISFTGVYIFPKDLKNAKGKVKVIRPSKGKQFHRAYLVNDQFYAREWDKGLLKLKGDKLELVPDGEKFTKERIYSLLPFADNKILVATRTEGFYIYDGQTFTPWRTDLTPFFNKAEIYNASFLHNKYYVFTTLNSGVVVLDTAGNPVQLVDQPKGLISNSVYYAYLDYNQNLWLGCENAISMLQIGLPISVFDQRMGVEGGTNDIHFYNDRLYVATNQGLYFKNWDGKSDILQPASNRFQLMTNSSGQTWSFFELDGKLRAGHFDGVLGIHNQRIRKVYQGQNHAMSFVRMPDEKMLVAGAEGLEMYNIKNREQWTKIKTYPQYPNTFDQYHYLQQDQSGTFWSSHENAGIFSFRLGKNDSLNKLTKYNAKKYGLPSNLNNRIFKIAGRVVFATEKGIYSFNKAKNKFVKDTLDRYVPNGERVFFLAEDHQGNVWCQIGDKIAVLKKSGEKYVPNYNHFAPLKGANVYCISTLKSGEVLMGTSEGIIHYSGDLDRNYNVSFSTFLQKVELENSEGRDSLIFAGIFSSKQGQTFDKQPKNLVKVFPFKFNNFRFAFSTPYYTQSETIQYSYYLENFDQKWSTWVNHKEKEYTNLPEGTYTFHLKARNVYGIESPAMSYSFIITPPWYRTVWAYIGFCLMALLLLWGVIWLNTRRLRQQKDFLELKVEERTTEISNKNKILEEQKEEIISKNEALEYQKEEITAKNVELETQKEEMMAQAEVLKSVNRELTQQKDEIERQRDEIELQRDSIQHQKNEIELQKNEIEEKKDEIEKQHSVLEKTNQIIHRKNQDITASIRYAQTIQQAILPFEERIKQLLGNHFVIYRPKDIVSGDFYWLDNLDDKVLVAAVDCTGHGVPGAFMSMIGYTLLNEIVSDRRIVQPAQVLEELHALTRLALRQESQANSDGMDLCLCMLEPLDEQQVQVTFAGAKRPLYYTPKNSHQIIEIKGNRHSIGGGKYSDAPKFTQQAFAVEKGSVLYLTTDGLIDQNNQERKKFGTARFQQLLKECASLPLNVQEEKLINALDQHQTGTEQRDDITVLAIEV
ncbi:SpoIIE family protein phosphatase [Microscilla marina]|uniref:Two component regulator three Y motif family n=1 Tax=Microscilla marina ATCC 23134 TaxID=313606 RepID=A1ZJI9_MICM2|nr:SpoIIE family protein phosphatase [Microscilla marina]EAY29292.1 Two component regulator three Y motif family [Microscilla marina ATCC 23134]